jgi:hypothetical protein
VRPSPYKRCFRRGTSEATTINVDHEQKDKLDGENGRIGEEYWEMGKEKW